MTTIYFPKSKINITYTIGKNAADNFAILDLAEPHHIWFHVEGQSSCHVIASIPPSVNSDRKTLSAIVKQGAVLCKQYSRYSGHKNLSISYTTVGNVQKHDRIVGTVLASNCKTVII